MCQPPAETAMALLIPLTATGVALRGATVGGAGSVVPLPSCPWSFCPQHCTVPF